jgi:hypothetical protein
VSRAVASTVGHRPDIVSLLASEPLRLPWPRGPRPVSVLKDPLAARSRGGGCMAMPHRPFRCVWPDAFALGLLNAPLQVAP